MGGQRWCPLPDKNHSQKRLEMSQNVTTDYTVPEAMIKIKLKPKSVCSNLNFPEILNTSVG